MIVRRTLEEGGGGGLEWWLIWEIAKHFQRWNNNGPGIVVLGQAVSLAGSCEGEYILIIRFFYILGMQKRSSSPLDLDIFKI